MSDDNGNPLDPRGHSLVFIPRTYEEMRQAKAREWQEAQATMRAELEGLRRQVMEMPDVKDAPQIGAPWVSQGTPACRACGCLTFTMKIWTTINGIRHRMGVTCEGCGQPGTWDWGDGAWVG